MSKLINMYVVKIKTTTDASSYGYHVKATVSIGYTKLIMTLYP